MAERTAAPPRPPGDRDRTGEQPLPTLRSPRPQDVVPVATQPSPPSPAPPPRPRLSSDLAPPRLAPDDPRPRALHVSAVLWRCAALAAVVTVVGAVLDRRDLHDRLTALALQADPGTPAEVVDAGVLVLLAVTLGGTILLALLSLGWLRLVLRRRSWARWILLVTAVPTLLIADLTQDTVSGGTELDRVASIAQAGLVALALVPLWLPSSRRWLGAAGTSAGRGG